MTRNVMVTRHLKMHTGLALSQVGPLLLDQESMEGFVDTLDKVIDDLDVAMKTKATVSIPMRWL